MTNRLINPLIALLLLGAAAAVAATGVPPGTGPGMVDGVWLNGLAGGMNRVYMSGITAAGSTQATAYQLPGGVELIEVDTTGSSTGVALPACYAGTMIILYNNGAQTLTIYPQIANNPLTAAQDTINNTTSFSAATHVMSTFICAKNGVWGAK